MKTNELDHEDNDGLKQGTRIFREESYANHANTESFIANLDHHNMELNT